MKFLDLEVFRQYEVHQKDSDITITKYKGYDKDKNTLLILETELSSGKISYASFVLSIFNHLGKVEHHFRTTDKGDTLLDTLEFLLSKL